MKRIIVLCGAGMLWASAALAQLDLTWNACPVDGGVADINVDCSVSAIHVLVGTFKSSVALGQVNAMDLYFDLQVEGASSLPPFWYFETGCNDFGLDISSNRGELIPPCTVETPWTVPNQASIVTFGPELGGPNRARILASVELTGTVALQANHDYYAFHLAINTDDAMENGGSCEGCNEKVAIVWNQADLYNVGSTSLFEVTGAGTYGNCIGWNGPSSLTCSSTPVKNRTWGAIKSQYR